MSLVNKSFGDIITFTRASVASRINSAGVMESVAANVPRIDYDPVTLACRGMLIEAQRTNMLLNSAAPSSQSVGVNAVTHTLSFFGTGSIALSGSYSGTLNGSGSNSRSTLTFTPTAGALTVTISGAVTNAQIEVGAFATSYIPTLAAQATRAGEVASISSVSPWFKGIGGTLFSEILVPFSGGNSSTTIASFDDGSNNNRFMLRRQESGNSTNVLFVKAGVINVNNNAGAGSLSAGNVHKLAMTFSAAEYKVFVDGISLNISGTPVAPESSVSEMSIGQFIGSQQLNGYIKKLRFIPNVLTNSELQSITS